MHSVKVKIYIYIYIYLCMYIGMKNQIYLRARKNP